MPCSPTIHSTERSHLPMFSGKEDTDLRSDAKVASFLTEAEYRFLRAQVKEARSAVDNRYTFAYQRLFGSAPAADVGDEKGIKNTNSASLLATSASVPASRPPSRNEDPYGSQWEATSKRGSDAQLSDLRLSVVKRRTPTAPQSHATQKRGSNNHRRTRPTPSRNSSEVDLAELGRLLTINKARTDIRSVYDASRTSTPFRFSHDTRSTYDTLRSVTPFRVSLCDLNFERVPTKLKLVNSSEVTGTVDDQEELDLDGVDTGSTLSEGRMEMISKKKKLECTLVDGQSEMAKEAGYKFASPLSKEFMQLDLEILSRSERDWRLQTMIRPSNRTEEMIIDRLIQMEKLQALTVDMERGGTSGAGKKGRTVGTVYQNQPKITSKASLTGSSRKVQNDSCYVQSWLDDEICPNCMDRHTVKSCLENAYESRCRVPMPSTMTRNGVTNKTDMTSCRQSNNLLSSKSIQSSTSRCGPSPSTDELTSTSELVRHFKLLGVRLDGSGKPPGSVSTGRPNSRARCPAGGGRASLVPGKSYKSQRKFSLTDTTPTPKPTQRLKSAAARLGKSGNRKRPQTAV